MASQSIVRQDLGHIERDPHSIKSIMNPTKDEMLLAIDLDPETIQYFEDKADQEIRERALLNDPRVIRFFKNPTDDEYKYVIMNVPQFYKIKELPYHLRDFATGIWLIRHPVLF